MAQLVAVGAEALEPRVEVVSLALDDLVEGSPFRDTGVCPEHVERLVGLDGHWPPILVSRSDRIVIDGLHRVAAARELGLDRIEASFFDGTAEEAFVEFVRRNVCHGLPLTLRERKRAACRVLAAHPRWSDRRIAELCAVSPKTVARVREQRPSEEIPHLDTRARVGRDNRVRPVPSASIRSRVADAIREQPGASLRTVAAAVGVSPETVRLVRLNLNQFTEPAKQWQEDAALVSSAGGEELLEWLERSAIVPDDLARTDFVPLSRIYEIADEARRRSEIWMQFARTLEARAGKVSK